MGGSSNTTTVRHHVRAAATSVFESIDLTIIMPGGGHEMAVLRARTVDVLNTFVDDAKYWGLHPALAANHSRSVLSRMDAVGDPAYVGVRHALRGPR